MLKSSFSENLERIIGEEKKDDAPQKSRERTNPQGTRTLRRPRPIAIPYSLFPIPCSS
jgi:hypothetical protein